MATESIGALIPTAIPGYADAADIQAALRAYHYGSYTYNPANTSPANLETPSIAKTIYDIQEDIVALENRPSSGGDVATTAPVPSDFTPSGIPNGYIWVDQDGTIGGAPISATAVFTSTAPTSNLSTGVIWVDQDPASITDNPFIATALINAKGDLIAGSANDTAVRVPAAATNGYVLNINSSTTSGLDWVDSASSTQTFTNKTISGTSNTITNISLTTGVTGTLPIANGGTGQTTASAAANALLPSQSTHSGKYLTTDGTNLSWGTVSGYSAPTLGTTSITSGSTVTTINGLTLTGATLTTPTLTLSSTTSTTSGRIAFDATADKIIVGDGTNAVEFASSTLITNAQTASYTLVLADKDKLVEMSVGSANNLTVPLNSSQAFPVGTQINILQTGAGQTTVVATGGVTINATPGLKLRAQWSSATLIKRGTDTWVLVGDITA